MMFYLRVLPYHYLKTSFHVNRAILVCWLTVNYQYFCSGLVEKYKMFKSNFFDIDKEKITVYEEKLQFQNVHSCFFPELKLKNSLADVKIDYTPMVLETQKVISKKINKFEEVLIVQIKKQ